MCIRDRYIAYAQRGELEKCAEESFDCVSCGCCSVRCPAEISHSMVGLLDVYKRQSPLSAYRGFFGCKHFSKANEFLKEHGMEPIDWQIENQ